MKKEEKGERRKGEGGEDVEERKIRWRGRRKEGRG